MKESAARPAPVPNLESQPLAESSALIEGLKKAKTVITDLLPYAHIEQTYNNAAERIQEWLPALPRGNFLITRVALVLLAAYISGCTLVADDSTTGTPSAQPTVQGTGSDAMAEWIQANAITQTTDTTAGPPPVTTAAATVMPTATPWGGSLNTLATSTPSAASAEQGNNGIEQAETNHLRIEDLSFLFSKDSKGRDTMYMGDGAEYDPDRDVWFQSSEARDGVGAQLAKENPNSTYYDIHYPKIVSDEEKVAITQQMEKLGNWLVSKYGENEWSFATLYEGRYAVVIGPADNPIGVYEARFSGGEQFEFVEANVPALAGTMETLAFTAVGLESVELRNDTNWAVLIDPLSSSNLNVTVTRFPATLYGADIPTVHEGIIANALAAQDVSSTSLLVGKDYYAVIPTYGEGQVEAVLYSVASNGFVEETGRWPHTDNTLSQLYEQITSVQTSRLPGIQQERVNEVVGGVKIPGYYEDLKSTQTSLRSSLESGRLTNGKEMYDFEGQLETQLNQLPSDVSRYAGIIRNTSMTLEKHLVNFILQTQYELPVSPSADDVDRIIDTSLANIPGTSLSREDILFLLASEGPIAHMSPLGKDPVLSKYSATDGMGNWNIWNHTDPATNNVFIELFSPQQNSMIRVQTAMGNEWLQTIPDVSLPIAIMHLDQIKHWVDDALLPTPPTYINDFFFRAPESGARMTGDQVIKHLHRELMSQYGLTDHQARVVLTVGVNHTWTNNYGNLAAYDPSVLTQVLSRGVNRDDVLVLYNELNNDTILTALVDTIIGGVRMKRHIQYGGDALRTNVVVTGRNGNGEEIVVIYGPFYTH